jgi:hypothetical protein
MLMKMPVRSGAYAMLIRYTCVGIGADTQTWELVVADQSQRTKRNRTTGGCCKPSATGDKAIRW